MTVREASGVVCRHHLAGLGHGALALGDDHKDHPSGQRYCSVGGGNLVDEGLLRGHRDSVGGTRVQSPHAGLDVGIAGAVVKADVAAGEVGVEGLDEGLAVDFHAEVLYLREVAVDQRADDGGDGASGRVGRGLGSLPRGRLSRHRRQSQPRQQQTEKQAFELHSGRGWDVV